MPVLDDVHVTCFLVLKQKKRWKGQGKAPSAVCLVVVVHHHQPPLIQHQTQFAPNNPAVVREAFAADLLRAAAFAHRVDQLDPIGVNDAEHRRGHQEDLRLGLMGREEAKEASALGEPRKQGPIVAR